jgi:transposase InsO family protein
MRTLTQYEVAWNMYRAKSSMEQITATVGRHRATIYRWLERIKRLGIKEFLRRKLTAKRRRQPRKLATTVRHLIRDIRRKYGWCGQKIQKELRVRHGVHLSLMTIYRILEAYFKLRKHRRRDRGSVVVATRPRELVEHDTVDFGELFAYTAIDCFTKEPCVVMATNLMSETGTSAFLAQKAYYGAAYCHQSDEGPEFLGIFPDAVTATKSVHRYSRPYKKNDQAHIENFNRSLRRECLGWGKYKKTDLEWVQAKVDAWVKHWMEERWHMGLPEMMTPAEHLKWYDEQQRDKESVAFAV